MCMLDLRVVLDTSIMRIRTRKDSHPKIIDAKIKIIIEQIRYIKIWTEACRLYLFIACIESHRHKRELASL